MNGVMVRIPEPLYHRLEQVAAQMHKPVQELVTETLQATLPEVEEIPASLRNEIANLERLDNIKLQLIAASEMVGADQSALEQLLDLGGIRQLNDDEQLQLERLRSEYGRLLLHKARAYALLSERGNPLPVE